MPSWLPSIAYAAPGQSGYWDPVTSTINWCEEDYYATPYAAEIVNTFTNVLFVYYSYIGIRGCIKHGHDTIFLVSYVGYALVGLGSFLFHATLKYPMQLVDELSMIYTTCLVCYATFSYSRSRLFSLYLALALVSLAIFITLYYHYLQDPVFHQVAYALLTVIALFRSLYVMVFTLHPSLKQSKNEYWLQHGGRSANAKERRISRQNDKRDQKILKTMGVMIAYGLSTFLGGFAIWSLDRVYCHELRIWRRELGLPWGILLEGHGWWHLMTGTGAYFYIQWGIWLRHCLNGRQEEYDLKWPRLWSLPEVVGTKKANGVGGLHSSKKEI